jgi:hypothetical protein
MINVECPWCAGPATVEADEFSCAECVVSVEIAPAASSEPVARAA